MQDGEERTMNMKLFLSTFALIFLAELGDKTQLAAMARTAAADTAKWTVFAGASAALVLSTLIAVVAGSAITRVVPEHVIKIGAGILFILFGVLILRGALSGERAPAAEAAPGMAAGVVLRLAGEFEAAASEDYERLAETGVSPELKALLLALAAEERGHLTQLKSAAAPRGESQIPGISREQVPYRMEVAAERAPSETNIVDRAIAHERATAGFYRELARLTPFASLKRSFSYLAAQEDDHARRLQELKDGAAPA
jgi:rubrerythrin